MKTEIETVFGQQDWRLLPELSVFVIEEAVNIQQIPAPTFEEAARAAHVMRRFQALGLADVHIDEVDNVYGTLPGKSGGRGLMLLAHTDTVFPANTDLRLKRSANRIMAPGIGDNSLGVAALLGLAKYLRDSGQEPACDLHFVADSCEEGLGDLRGAKAAFAKLRDRTAAVINLEGLAFGHVYNAGAASHRLRIRALCEGGHSWLHYGKPSAAHNIMILGSRIAALKPPQQPRTTLNIGMIEGGHAINAIATEASLWLDMRSVCAESLAQLHHRVKQLVDQQRATGVQFIAETVGARPAGKLPADHDLARGALLALSQLGIQGALEAGSTDANVPLSQGCPAVTIGITRGGNAHRHDEFIELAPVRMGMQQLITLVLAAASFYGGLTA